MMKSIRFGLILAIIGMMALPAISFADDSSTPSITWSAWGRGLFAPFVSNDVGPNDDEGEIVPIDASSWGGHTRIGFTIKGESERAGFQVDMNADGGSLGMQDQQKIWVKPIDILTVEIGPTVFYDTLRGNTAFGSWDWGRFSNIMGEDNVFMRGTAGAGDGKWNFYGAGDAGGRYNLDYEADPAAGAIVHVDTNGFHTFASWNIVEEGRMVDTNGDDVEDFEEHYTSALMFARGQYGVGYEIPNFGLVRAQYFGKAYAKEGETYVTGEDELETYGVFNAAIKIDQLIKNLYLDMGVFLPTDDEPENSRVAIYANYKFGRFTPHLLIGAEFDQVKWVENIADYDEDDTDTGLKIGLGADIDLGSDLTLVLDLRIHNETAAQHKDGQTAYLVGIQKGFSNGIIGIGYEATNQNWGGDPITKEETDDVAWAIPIKVEYWF